MISEPTHASIQDYIIHNVYLLYVTITRVPILREVYYKGQMHQKIREIFESMQIYKILDVKNNA
jgi:hypothetical protein